MKKSVILTLLVCVAVLMMAACASGQQKSAVSNTTVKMPLFNESWELPCQMYDDDDYFATVGMAAGSIDQKVELQKTALGNAQDICRQKVKQEYWDIDEGGRIVDTFINNAQAKCVKYSNITEEGKIEVYVGIRISKRELAEKIVNEVLIKIEERKRTKIDFDEAKYRSDIGENFEKLEEKKADETVKLTEEEKAQLAFNEAEFRKEMEKRLKQYEEADKEKFDKVQKENPRDNKNEKKVPSTCVSEAHQTVSLGESRELPCQMYDDDDYFAAVGIAKGDIDEKGRLQELALYDARRIVEWKVRPAYYSMGVIIAMKVNEVLSTDREDNITDKIRKAGDSVIKTTIKNAQAECVKYSGIMEDGMIEAYVGIKISRRKLAEEMLREIRKVLSENKKNEISFDEYRKRMEETFQQYKESKEKEKIDFHEEYFREKATPEKTEENK